MATTTIQPDSTTAVPVTPSCRFLPSDQAPNSSQVIQLLSEIGAGAYVYMAVPVLLFTVMTIIYVEEALFIMKNTERWRRTQHKLWILSAFPVISGLCVIGIFFPRSSPTIQFIISFYNAICMKKYSDLILHYYGGKKKMAEITNEIAVIPYAFPCFMWVCFPKIIMNVRNINIMQYLIYPVTVFQPVVYFILTILWGEGIQNTSLSILVLFLQVTIPLASFVAVYGFVIMNKASTEALQNYRIAGKFVAIQLILGINTVQGVILILLDRFRAIPCVFPYPAPKPGYLLHIYILPLELFLLSLMARHYFRFSEQGLQPIPAKRELRIVDDENKIPENETDENVFKTENEHDNDSDYRSQSDTRSSKSDNKSVMTGPKTHGVVAYDEKSHSPASLTSFRYSSNESLRSTKI